MKFANTFISLLSLAASSALVSASPAPRAAQDVFVPPITSPKGGDVWTVKTKQTVTWDISHAPVNITNKRGRLRLRKSGTSTPLFLADDFDILLGAIEVDVPLVQEGDDYSLLLFGDSGNWSDDFTITGGPEN